MYLKENDVRICSKQQLMSKEFITKILSFKSDKLREKIGKNAHNLFKYDAANNIAKLILEGCVFKKYKKIFLGVGGIGMSALAVDEDKRLKCMVG